MMTEWQNCYDEGWKGLIVDDAFAHPAKMSYALAGRIYDHAFRSGWLKPGDTVVDPFGGIGGTAIHAACHGLRWLGCELEPKFHVLGNQNIDLWQARFGNYPEWVRPTLHCGDSRRLAEVIGMADSCISSPPFIDARQNTTASRKGDSAPTRHDPKAWCVVSSPPYAGNEKSDYRVKDDDGLDRDERRGFQQGQGCFRGSENYGKTDGQLGSMREGDFAAVVLTSPPYAESVNAQSHGIDWTKVDPASTGNRKRGPGTKHEETFTYHLAYGSTPGQLGAMVVGSPPFEGSLDRGVVPAADRVALARANGISNAEFVSPIDMEKIGKRTQEYGGTSGQLGNSEGETFWTAARDIVAQCGLILRPGGHAIWVCKDFVRKGKRVPFSDQWQALCESLGFRLVCRHRAMLVKTGATQKLLDGGTHTTTRERKSFFRRLAEKKGSPRIDWEDVICMQVG